MTARLGLLLLALVSPTAGLGVWFGLGPPPVLELDLARIPLTLGAWSALGDQKLDTEVAAQLEPDAYVFRPYVRQGAPAENVPSEAGHTGPVWAYVAFYRRFGQLGSGGAHRPEVCYPAQGFEVSAQRAQTVELAGDRKLHVRVLRTERDGVVEHVLYWFQPASRWPAGDTAEQLLRVWDAIRRRPQYAFVRLSVRSGRDVPEIRALEELAAALAPHVRGVLEGREPSGVHSVERLEGQSRDLF